eukprot:TRINITY_DN13276_c0_g1_i2.p1 TRINITY_DN13276_c0_g1~~TRINITY_DN13276_c0_g1_i2.p1  ORF type:complete len:152 (+),score=24.43 TRINITY_DN13276_c0_g1_i2:136-591(+)
MLCKALTWNTKVTRLYLAGCGLDDECLVGLFNAISMSNVRELYLTRNGGVGDSSVTYLLKVLPHTNLCKVVFSKKNVSAPLLDQLSTSLSANPYTPVSPPKGYIPLLEHDECSEYKPGKGWDMFTTPEACLMLLKHQRELAERLGFEIKPI